MKKKIGFCIPCYNEEKNILKLYNAIKENTKEFDNYKFTYLFIDNCSTDNSRAILKELSKDNTNIEVLFNTKNFGPERSGAFGFYNTAGDAVITMACDLQDPPELIGTFIKKWEEGNKLVLGRKISSNEKKSMFFFRKLYYKIISLFIKDDGVNQVTGYGLYDREIIEKMKKIPQPSPNFRFLLSELGFNRTFIDYIQPKRAEGKSSYNFFSYLNLAIVSLINNTNKPIRIVLYTGLFLTICSTFLFMYILISSLFFKSFNLLYLLISTGIIMISLMIFCIGLIGEYVALILEYQKKYPLVEIDEAFNIDEENLL